VERKNTHKVFTAASERTIKVKSGHHPQHHPCINIHLGQQQGKYNIVKSKRKLTRQKKGESDRGGGHLQLIHSFKKLSPD